MAAIVVVDDNKLTCNQLKRVLEGQMGHSVVARGENGEEAVSLYREHKPELMTLDLTMPNKDGLTALKEILAEFPEAKIVIVSAVQDDETMNELKGRAKAIITKPLQFNEQDFMNNFITTINGIIA